jgi:hypothetical protein
MRAGSFSTQVMPDERTPLIQNPLEDSEETLIHDSSEEDDITSEDSKYKVILREFWVLFRGSIPGLSEA